VYIFYLFSLWLNGTNYDVHDAHCGIEAVYTRGLVKVRFQHRRHDWR